MKTPIEFDGVLVLEAEKGKCFTNGEVSSKLVFIGKNDKAENWIETDETEEIE